MAQLSSVENHLCPRGIVLSTGANPLKSLCLTNIVLKRGPVDASAAEAAECGQKPERLRRNRGGSPQVRFASGSSYGHYPCDGCQLNIVAPAAATLPFCPAAIYPLGHFVCANLRPSLSLERDGRSYHCCSPYRTWHCGNPPRDNRRDTRRCLQQQRCR